MQPRAGRQFARDVGHQRFGGRAGPGMRRRLAEDQRIDRKESPGLAIGGAAHHHAIHMGEMVAGVLDGRDAAIEDHRQVRPRGLQAIDAIIIERGNVAVLCRRQALEPGLARMDDQRVGAGGDHRIGHGIERRLRVLVVNADAALDRDRDRRPPPSWRRCIRRQALARPSGRRRSGPPAPGPRGSRR